MMQDMFPSLDQLSHATIITGNRVSNLESIKDFLASQGFATTANPDFYVFNDEQLLMDDAIAITQMLTAQKLGAHRVYVIAADRIGHEVQNTLLKTIEEPHTGTYIMLVVPNTDSLLSTILSRAQVIAGNKEAADLRFSVSEFLAATPAARFALVESWTKNKKDEDNASKTEVIAFITELQKTLWEAGNRDQQLFVDIERMRDYASIRGASHRVILDFLGMVCPELKLK